MIITSQGFGHFTNGLNNQDFGIESSRMLLILDGCSDAKYSEIGTRLFAQLFMRKEEFDRVQKFEDNVKSVFNDIITMMEKYYPLYEDLEGFIMENLLFTIIACFKTEDKYIVKLFGDGYIITQNNKKLTSYIKFSYGKCPPYFAYKYCHLAVSIDFADYNFKTFTFDKKIFPKVGIATDGIMPIAKGYVTGLDNIVSVDEYLIKMILKNQRQNFYDDITFGRFGG